MSDGEVMLGPLPGLYAVTRQSVHRNLYLVPLIEERIQIMVVDVPSVPEISFVFCVLFRQRLALVQWDSEDIPLNRHSGISIDRRIGTWREINRVVSQFEFLSAVRGGASRD